MILKKLKEFLDNNNIKYTIIAHSQAFTAQEIAAITHIPGKELAKSVIVKIDGDLMMVVLPASEMIDFKLLKQAIGVKKVELATEEEFMNSFPDCEIGAMPPFGNLFNMQTLVSESLTKDEEIAFNAGTHKELVKMAYKDFERLVVPKIANISVKKKCSTEENWKYET